jgi:peroxiredoxin
VNRRVVALLTGTLFALIGATLYVAANRPVRDELGLDFSQPKHPVTDEMRRETEARKGALVPIFDGEDLTGEPVKIGGDRGPQFVLFIKNDCPCSVDAQPLMNRMAEKFKGKVEFVGITDGNPAQAKKWSSFNDARFPIVSEPSTALMAKMDAERSVYSALVVDGKVAKMYPGYSAGMLKDLNSRLSKITGMKETAFDPQYAPKEMLSGCKYEIKK